MEEAQKCVAALDVDQDGDCPKTYCHDLRVCRENCGCINVDCELKNNSKRNKSRCESID